MDDFTLTEKLARMMFQVDVPTKMKEQEAQWDPNGGGMITVGEFRQHVRGVGVEAGNDEIDALFNDWDKDGGGSIDMAELEKGLIRLRAEFMRKYGSHGWKLSIDQQVESLRARATAGRTALGASQKATVQEGELNELLADINGRLGVALGTVLVKRKIRVGEVVGTWCKSKGNAAKRARSKQPTATPTTLVG